MPARFERSGQPQLRMSAVAYIDELGTKARFENFTQSRLMDTLQHYASIERVLPDSSGLHEFGRLLSFSDNIVIGVPVDEEDGFVDEEIAATLSTSLIERSARYQIEMMTNGRVLRGGFSVGNLYMDDRLVIGPAHVDAVVLEETIALYPRIVVSAGALDIIVRAHLTHQISARPPQSIILVDSDGLPFIDYLGIVPHLYPDEVIQRYYYSAHRELVEQRLQLSAGRVRQKYVWMAHYHKYCLRRLTDVDSSYDDLATCAGLEAFEDAHPRRFSTIAAY